MMITSWRFKQENKWITPKHRLKVMTWNARSLINRNKQEYLWIKFSSLKSEVAVITETRLNYKLFTRNQNYVWALSLHEGSKGIAIITRKELWWREENIREFEGYIKLMSVGEITAKCLYLEFILTKITGRKY